MSKGKNNNKNKVTKVPVKTQQMKHQKPITNQKVKEIKAGQIAISKAITNTSAKGLKKENPKDKKIVKVLDIAESCDDDDESDVVSEDIDFDSDIDDVDLEDSDDNIEGDSDDESNDIVNAESDDDSDINDEDLDNSDYESIEMDESKLNDDSKDETKVQSKTETKNATKHIVEAPKKEKVAKETVPKIEKKEVLKNIKINNIEKEITNVSNADQKILDEVNLRKNMVSNCTVFVSHMQPSIKREDITKMLAPIVPVNINIPHKMKAKATISRGYGFVRLANEKDAEKAIEILNGKDSNGTKLSASTFVCKRVFDEIKKIDLSRIVVHSFKYEDITDELKSHFKVPVSKHMITQYEMAFDSEDGASTLFNKKTMTLNGRELLFNYLYCLKPRPVVSEEVKAEVKKQIKAEVNKPIKAEVNKPIKAEVNKPVKAGVKRSNCDSDDNEVEQIAKKTKLNNGIEIKKVQVEKPKIEAKKLQAVVKKPVEVKKVEQVKQEGFKKEFNKSPQNKKPFNKAAGGKKQNPKAQGNKQEAGKKPFNKQGNKKPFNKKK